MSIGATSSPWGLWEPPLLLPPTLLGKNRNYRQIHLFENKHMQDAKLWDIHTYLTGVCSHNFPNPINFTTGLLSLAEEWCRRNYFNLSAKTIPCIQSTWNSQQNTEPQFTTSHETTPISTFKSSTHAVIMFLLRSRMYGKIHVQWNEKAI